MNKKNTVFNKLLLQQSIQAMKTTYQMENVQTIWEHGLSVARHYKKLISDLERIASGYPEKHNLFIPDAIKENAVFFLINKKISGIQMQKYLVFHDIGKPNCQETDSFG
jgi:hypothetical protein